MRQFANMRRRATAREGRENIYRQRKTLWKYSEEPEKVPRPLLTAFLVDFSVQMGIISRICWEYIAYLPIWQDHNNQRQATKTARILSFFNSLVERPESLFFVITRLEL